MCPDAVSAEWWGECTGKVFLFTRLNESRCNLILPHVLPIRPRARLARVPGGSVVRSPQTLRGLEVGLEQKKGCILFALHLIYRWGFFCDISIFPWLLYARTKNLQKTSNYTRDILIIYQKLEFIFIIYPFKITEKGCLPWLGQPAEFVAGSAHFRKLKADSVMDCLRLSSGKTKVISFSDSFNTHSHLRCSNFPSPL